MISLSRQRRIARASVPSRAVVCSKGVPVWSPQLAAWPLPLSCPAPGGGSPRQQAAFRMRQAAAQAYLDEPQPLHRSNGDEDRYADKRASFTKTLPHNDAGEVDADAFATFVSVLSSGDPSGFETIPRDRNAEVELNDPQATYAFDLVGLDGRRDQPRPAASLCQRSHGNRDGGALLAGADAGRAF